MKKLLTILSALLLWVATACAAATQIDIYSVNDWHGYLRAGDNVPGAARLAYALDELMQRNKNGTVLVGGGDMLSGNADANEFNGLSVIAAMNRMGFSANCAGNHAFDYNADIIKQQAKAANFPLLAANIIDSRSGRIAEPFVPYTVVERQGVKIGFIGVLGQDALAKVKPAYVNGLRITEPTAAVNKYAAELRQSGVQIVVLLAHIGCEQNADSTISGPVVPLIKNLRGVDAVVTADSHTLVAGQVSTMPVVQAGEYGRYIGHIRMDYDTEAGEVTNAEAMTYNVQQLPPGSDAEMAALLKPYFDKLDAKYSKVLAYNNRPLGNDKYGESAVADYFMDLLNTELKTDLVLYNGGAVRSSLPAGNVTLRQVKQVLPFNNTLYVVQLKGKDILAALKHGIGNSQIGRLRYAGLAVTARLTPDGTQIERALLNDGAALQPDKFYRVAVNDFLLDCGDGYTSIKNAKNPYPAGQDAEILTRALAKAKVINYRADSRLVLK